MESQYDWMKRTERRFSKASSMGSEDNQALGSGQKKDALELVEESPFSTLDRFLSKKPSLLFDESFTSEDFQRITHAWKKKNDLVESE